MDQNKTEGMRVDGWDRCLRDAREHGEAVVVRGEGASLEVEAVKIDMSAPDLFEDACRRAEFD